MVLTALGVEGNCFWLCGNTAGYCGYSGVRVKNFAVTICSRFDVEGPKRNLAAQQPILRSDPADTVREIIEEEGIIRLKEQELDPSDPLLFHSTKSR